MLDGQECSRIYGLSGVLGIFASTVDDECLLVEFLCLPFIFISIISSFELFTAIFGITGPWFYRLVTFCNSSKIREETREYR